MRSLVIERFGDPQAVLCLREQPLPEPGPGEVRLKMLLSPMHTHDLELVRGEYGHRPSLPMVPGSEAVARVDALGAGVAGLQRGQRVCVAGAAATWAEYFVAQADRVVPVPEALPDEAACQLLAMPMSAMMLVDDLALQPGEWMIQNAAGGAVGRVVNALAARRGFHVINLVRSAAAAETMRRAGHPHVLATDDPCWPAQVARITAGARLLRAVDSLGGDAPNALLGVLDEGGTLVSFGSMVSLTLRLHVEQLLYKATTVRGFWAARRGARSSPEERARWLHEIVQMVLAGDLALPVEQAFALQDIGAALASATRPRSGKIALRA